MKNCNACGSGLPDDAKTCPFCGAEYIDNNVYQAPPQPQYGAAPPPQGAPAPNPYGAGYNNNPAFDVYYQQQQAMQNTSDASTAKTLGIVALVCAFTGLGIVSFICGAIGISKAKAVLLYAQNIHNQLLISEATSAKKLCIGGIIAAAAIIVLGIITSILIMLFSYGTMYYSFKNFEMLISMLQ